MSWSVNISMSSSEDSLRMGFDEFEINRMTVRMGQFFINTGMRVIFGHDWRDDGVMRAIANYAEIVARHEECSPDDKDSWRMLNVVSTPRELTSRHAVDAENNARGVLRLECLRDIEQDIDQLSVKRYLQDSITSHKERGIELTKLGCYITQLLDPGCRICIGGRTSGFEGREPDIYEEARLALCYGKPLFLMGGFGGASKKFGESPENEYWNSENGLDQREKDDVFKTTDIERALNIVSRGIARLSGRQQV